MFPNLLNVILFLNYHYIIERFYRNIPLLLWTITCSIIALVSILLLKAGWLGVIDIRDG